MSRIIRVIYFFPICLIFTNLFLCINNLTLTAQTIISTFKHPVYSTSDIYVITNREADTSNVKFSFTNSVKKDPSLSFYRVNASCVDTFQLIRLDSTAFINEISKIKSQDWLLYVHGDSKTFEQATRRGLDIQNKYNVRVIVFAWPSKDIKIHGLENFYTSHKNVEGSLNHFCLVLRTMSELRNSCLFNENHISLFLHSLGNYFLPCIVEKMLLQTLPLTFDNIIINAAAVEQKNHKMWVEQLQIQKNIFITSNKQDFNLNGLSFFTSHRRQLGQKVKKPVANNATYFNFSKSVGFQIHVGYSHTYFIGKMPEKNKNIHQLYFEIFHGCIPNLSDETRFKKKTKSFNDIIIK